MKSIVTGLALFVWCLSSFSQDSGFVFEKNLRVIDISAIDYNEVKDHPLGREIAAKLVLLKDVYTYVEPATPASPTDKTVVVKPIIYNSVLKLNRHYKKMEKKGLLDVEQGRNEFNVIINKALTLYSEDTEEFENVLRKSKKPEDIIKAYELVVLK